MYSGDNFRRVDSDTFEMKLPKGREFKILQLTDIHFGNGFLSRRNDKHALESITTLITRTEPDLIIFTGDTIFPMFIRTGTGNNRKEARKFLDFMDLFKTPYAFVMGNHDSEIGSKLNRKQLAEEFKRGEYSIFANGPREIFGVGNYFINLVTEENWSRGEAAAQAYKGKKDAKSADYVSCTSMALALLDSNMYGEGWLLSGFDRIHADQTEWCMNRLNRLKEVNPSVRAMAFFHMPLKEFKDAYEQMKLGDSSIQYHFGGIGEKEDYFGISRYKGDFFEKAHANDTICAMFCGHDHLNTLSLTYKGIRMTYGMSIDYHTYKGISKQQIQRGGTLIFVSEDGKINVRPEPLTRFVSPRIRGMRELVEKAMEEMTRQADAARAKLNSLEKERAQKRAEAEAERAARRKEFMDRIAALQAEAKALAKKSSEGKKKRRK